MTNDEYAANMKTAYAENPSTVYPELHSYTDDGSDPGNCSVCHFFHTDRRGPHGELPLEYVVYDDDLEDVLEAFATEPEAAEFISTLPEYEWGRYRILEHLPRN